MDAARLRASAATLRSVAAPLDTALAGCLARVPGALQGPAASRLTADLRFHQGALARAAEGLQRRASSLERQAAAIEAAATP